MYIEQRKTQWSQIQSSKFQAYAFQNCSLHLGRTTPDMDSGTQGARAEIHKDGGTTPNGSTPVDL